jgi:uncharacterized circularly permuted ATP-grasp superfamily protein
MAAIETIIQHYHDLVAAQSEATHQMLAEQLKARRLYFGQTPVCRVLRPHFYLKDAWDYLQARTEVVLRAFAKVHRACLEDPALRAQLYLEPFEEEMLASDRAAGIATPWTSSRLDAFYNPGTGYLRFVEYNAETPAGIGYGDGLTDAFLALPVMAQFAERYAVHQMRGMGNLRDSLLRGYRAWGGKDQPNIAIVDWPTVPTRNEHDIIRDDFEAHGHRTVWAAPEELDFHDGALYAGDLRIDMIYKRVLCTELVHKLGMDSAIVRAVKANAVYMTNAFSSKVLAKKASLAVLSDERNAQLFTADEHDAIAQHIPWTRTVEDRRTLYDGREVDLLQFIADNRHKLVLKPNDEYGGAGVVIGWEASADDWAATIQTALTTPFVVQERVETITRDYPMVIDGALDISPRFVDADPYVFYGETISSCLTRLSSAALLNVTAGTGSVVPMFVVEARG